MEVLSYRWVYLTVALEGRWKKIMEYGMGNEVTTLRIWMKAINQ